MASTYATTPYRGVNTSLPAGYMQAATAPGRNIAAGIEQAGKAIGSGLGQAIANYRKNKEDDEAVTQMLETTIPGVMESSQLEIRAGNDDEEAAAFIKQAKKFENGEMKLSEKKSFAAALMLFREREQKQQSANEESQRFWYQQNQAKEDRDRRWKAEEDHRAWQKEQALWNTARLHGIDMAAAEDRKLAAEKRASDEAAAVAVLNYIPGGPVKGTKDVLVPNPAIPEYLKRQKEIQAEVDAAQAAVDKFSQAPASIPPAYRPIPEGGPSSAERNAALHWLRKNHDAVEGARRTMAAELPRNYPNAGMLYDLIQDDETKARHKDLYGNLSEVVNHPMKVPPGEAIRQFAPAPETQESQRMSAAHLDALGLFRDAQFRQQQLGEAPPEQITETRPTSRAMTNEETEARIRQHIEETMPNASSTAKLAAMRQLMSQEAPEIQTIKDEYGNEAVRFPQGYTPKQKQPPMSLQDQIRLAEYNDGQRALTVEGFTGKTRTAQQATDFAQEVRIAKEATNGIDQLLEMIDTPGKSLSLQERARASVIQNTLIGSLRLKIVGPGALSEKEIEVLKATIADPTKFFAFDSTIKASLEKMKQYLSDGIAIGAESLGLSRAGEQAQAQPQGEEAFTKRASNGVQYNRR